MAWKHNGRTIKIGKAWVADDNTKHPRGWVNWSADRKEAMSLVWEDDPTPLAPYDNFYYWGWNSDGDALLPKPLADLKTAKIDQAKQTSASLLQNTDWYVTRKSETSTAIPSGITAYRTAVRANYTTLKTAINNASDIAGLQACYETVAGASQTAKTIDATSSSVVSTSDNTITSNGHGFVNDEQVYYNVGQNSDKENAAVIGGLVNNTTYYVISTATNTFKLSESHSNCGDAAVVSLTGLSSDGTAQTFTSQGKPSAGQTFPRDNMPKYGA
jgi:hypothetical protein